MDSSSFELYGEILTLGYWGMLFFLWFPSVASHLSENKKVEALKEGPVSDFLGRGGLFGVNANESGRKPS